MGGTFIIINYHISLFVIGRGLTIEHYRPNTQCNVLEELEPVDQNLNYDFNFQQFTHLTNEELVLPVSIILQMK